MASAQYPATESFQAQCLQLFSSLRIAIRFFFFFVYQPRKADENALNDGN